MNSVTQIKIMVFLERLWLVAALLGVGLTIYFLITKDNDSALFFLGFFILSSLLYLLRKRQRVRYQDRQANPPEQYDPAKRK